MLQFTSHCSRADSAPAAHQDTLKFPWSSVVVDGKGVAQQAWKLEKESSAVFVLDTSGHLLFTKDGKLTDAEVSAVLALIEAALATETA